jgi:uncharacterized protein (TIGR04255 family)
MRPASARGSEMIQNQRYKRPPLIEAVLEFRFDDVSSERDLVRLKERLARGYPAVEEQRNFQVKLEVGAEAEQMGIAGYKLTANNAVDVVLIQPSRLAPYLGWEHLVTNAKSNFDAVDKVLGYRRVTRIGARFVNRIDMPIDQLGDRNIGDLLNIRISLPDGLASSRGIFSLATNFVHEKSGVKFLAQVGIGGEPTLIDRASIFLDIDASIDSNLPANIERVWELLHTLQEAKDEVFETFITDEIRGTFQ